LTRPVQALTIHQPWAWAVVEDLKPVENRTWKPPASAIGKYLMIHAGKTTVDDATVMSIEDMAGRVVPGTLPLGAIVGCAMLKGVVSVAGDTDAREHFQRDLYLRGGPHYRWLTGPYGWVFAHAVKFANPIRCRGRQKLWVVPPPIAEACRREFENSKE
jgi:hypothetical protein